MASTYSPTLRTELPATGDQNDAWAATVDNNLDVPIEDGLAGIATINVPDANVTLTTANALTDQARMPVLVFTGALTAQRAIIAPQVPKVYIVRNNTTGGQNLVMRTAATITLVTDTGIPQPYSATAYSDSSTASIPVPGVIIPPNSTAYVYTDGTLFDYCVNSLPTAAAADSVVLASPLPIANGGTGASTQSAARSNLGLGSAALLDADTASTSNTAPLRDGSGSFSAATITAGLNGLAAEASNANLLGNISPAGYEAIGANSGRVALPFNPGNSNNIDLYTNFGSGIFYMWYRSSADGFSADLFATVYVIQNGMTVALRDSATARSIYGQHLVMTPSGASAFGVLLGLYKQSVHQ